MKLHKNPLKLALMLATLDETMLRTNVLPVPVEWLQISGFRQDNLLIILPSKSFYELAFYDWGKKHEEYLIDHTLAFRNPIYF